MWHRTYSKMLHRGRPERWTRGLLPPKQDLARQVPTPPGDTPKTQELRTDEMKMLTCAQCAGR